MSIVRDPGLKSEGIEKIEWVKNNMPVLKHLADRFSEEKPLAGATVGMCIHLEAKTAYLACVLMEAGAEVAITGSNPLSTQDDVAAGLASLGAHVYSWYDATEREYDDFLLKVLEHRPQLLLDDGADLTSALYQERKEGQKAVRGVTEQTTTGVLRFRAMEEEGTLTVPVLTGNDAKSKHLFDNRYGTGQSVWDGIMRTTNLTVAGKTVVVVGYGWCGKGVAARADGLGARVIVCEVDAIKANEALMDGYQVMPLVEACPKGDVFITVTGCNEVISDEHFAAMKDGALLANAGHFDVEIDVDALHARALKVNRVRRNIACYGLGDGRRVYLLAEGRLVNLAAADGHPAEIMDMSFALQLLALRYLWKEGTNLPQKVLPVPEHIDREVAQLRLDALGVEIDQLNQQQKDYLKSWRRS